MGCEIGLAQGRCLHTIRKRAGRGCNPCHKKRCPHPERSEGSRSW